MALAAFLWTTLLLPERSIIVPCRCLLFFKSQRVRLVTISFETLASGAYRQELKITLSDVQISSISDAGTGATIPQERLTLAYGKISVFDPQTGQTSTYDVALGR